MHDFVSFNGRIISAADVQLPALAAATLYGKGVFTTVAVYGGIAEWWFEHWRRLSRDAPKVGVDISALDLAGTGHAIDELVRQNSVKDGRARVTFFDGSPTELWPYSLPNQTSVLITTADFLPKPENLKLTVSPYAINTASPLTGVKSCNYMEKILAKSEARARGFHECIQLNERGEVVSASMANVFWRKDDQLYTPSLKTGCVPGITRLQGIEGSDCMEVEAGLADLRSADGIFLTSAGLCAVQVVEFDGAPLPAECDEFVLGFERFG